MPPSLRNISLTLDILSSSFFILHLRTIPSCHVFYKAAPAEEAAPVEEEAAPAAEEAAPAAEEAAPAEEEAAPAAE
jgi:hypothetical protein